MELTPERKFNSAGKRLRRLSNAGDLVYRNKPRSIIQLKQNIRNEISAIEPVLLGRVMQKFDIRLQECIRCPGGYLRNVVFKKEADIKFGWAHRVMNEEKVTNNHHPGNMSYVGNRTPTLPRDHSDGHMRINVGEMSPRSNAERYPAIMVQLVDRRAWKNPYQLTCSNQDLNPGLLVSRTGWYKLPGWGLLRIFAQPIESELLGTFSVEPRTHLAFINSYVIVIIAIVRVKFMVQRALSQLRRLAADLELRLVVSSIPACADYLIWVFRDFPQRYLTTLHQLLGYLASIELVIPRLGRGLLNISLTVVKKLGKTQPVAMRSTVGGDAQLGTGSGVPMASRNFINTIAPVAGDKESVRNCPQINEISTKKERLETATNTRKNPCTIPASANFPKAPLSVRGKTPPRVGPPQVPLQKPFNIAELHSTEAGRESQQLREAAGRVI
ncbi:hypothetical protein ANN_24852 [Periplaneta americana]|uniref:Uncharacterized protein n=1 Tax=Periplaneta americana TaxID=6978 RepID=A0ABQ8S019_PERAM|nr:hypothetical protein ANN_24852 [Periplaneta americana]